MVCRHFDSRPGLDDVLSARPSVFADPMPRRQTDRQTQVGSVNRDGRKKRRRYQRLTETAESPQDMRVACARIVGAVLTSLHDMKCPVVAIASQPGRYSTTLPQTLSISDFFFFFFFPRSPSEIGFCLLPSFSQIGASFVSAALLYSYIRLRRRRR